MGRFADLGEGEGFGDVPKSKSRKKLPQAEDEGKSSCEKMRVVLGALLMVAVCQNLRASPTAAGPQTGMGLPNGLRRRKFRSSEIPKFRSFDKIAEK